MIGKLLLPLMWKFKKLMLVMIFVSALAVSLLIGLTGAYKTLTYSIDRYLEDYHCSDIQITTDKADMSLKEEIEKLDGVQAVNTRLAYDLPIRLPNGRLISMRIFSTSPRDFMNYYVWERNESSEYPNVAVEMRFAKYNNIHVGDIIEGKIDGKFEKVCIGSIVSSPECLGAVRDAYSWGENSDFSFLFVPEAMTYDSDLYRQCDQFLICTEDGAQDEAVLENVKQFLTGHGIEIKSGILFEDSAVHARIVFDEEPLEKLLYIVPSIFFVSTLLVIVLFFSQIINQCRKNIGILRACGFSRGKIRGLFCVIALILTLIGCALGYGLSYIVREIIIRMFAEGMGLPMVYMRIDPAYIGIALVAIVLCGQAATLYSTVRLSKIQPAEAMSRELSSSGEMPLSVANLFNRMSPAMKFSFLSLLRNAKRFVISTLCIAVTMALILLSISFYVSKEFMLEDTFAYRFHDDAQIFTQDEPTAERLAELATVEGVSDVEMMTYMRVMLVGGTGSQEITVCGLPENAKNVTIFDRDRNVIDVPQTGILLVTHLADDLGINVGDTVTVNGVSLTVEGLSDQCLNWMNYVSEATAATIGEVDQYSIFCKATDETSLIRHVSEWEDYQYTNIKATSRSSNERQFLQYDTVVYTLIAFAVVMGLLIVYNTTEMNLFEQKKSLSVLRTLGFQVRDVSRIWFVQTALQFVLATVIGLTAGTLLAKFTLITLAGKERVYPFIHDPDQYILTVVIVLLYVIISHLMAMRQVRKWDLVENIKEKE